MKYVRRRLGIILIVASLSAALLVVQSLVARKVISESFATLEQRQGERSINQVLKALEADLNQLAISTHDYATWDDAFDFVKTRDSHFIVSNMDAETLGNMRVDVVWMIDDAGGEILSYERFPESKSPVTADAGTIDAIRARLAGLLELPATGVRSRFFQTERGLLAVAAYPILPSRGAGTQRGTLVFGRFVDQGAVERAQTTSQLPLRLYITVSSRNRLPAQAKALWTASRTSADRVLVPTDDTTLSGFVLLRDVNGAPAAILATSITRSLIVFGERTGHSLIILFAMVIAVFAAIVCILLLYVEKVGRARATSERRYRAVITQAYETILLVDTAEPQNPRGESRGVRNPGIFDRGTGGNGHRRALLRV